MLLAAWFCLFVCLFTSRHGSDSLFGKMFLFQWFDRQLMSNDVRFLPILRLKSFCWQQLRHWTRINIFMTLKSRAGFNCHFRGCACLWKLSKLSQRCRNMHDRHPQAGHFVMKTFALYGHQQASSNWTTVSARFQFYSPSAVREHEYIRGTCVRF